jgi:excisionase family DNA binding protein
MSEDHLASPNNEFTTVAGICAQLDVARPTVEAWLASGELAHYRLGPRIIRIRHRDLEDFLEARRHSGAPDLAAENIRSRCSSPANDQAGSTSDGVAA